MVAVTVPHQNSCRALHTLNSSLPKTHESTYNSATSSTPTMSSTNNPARTKESSYTSHTNDVAWRGPRTRASYIEARLLKAAKILGVNLPATSLLFATKGVKIDSKDMPLSPIPLTSNKENIPNTDLQQQAAAKNNDLEVTVQPNKRKRGDTPQPKEIHEFNNNIPISDIHTLRIMTYEIHTSSYIKLCTVRNPLATKLTYQNIISLLKEKWGLLFMKQLSQEGAMFDVGLPYTPNEYMDIANRKHNLQKAVAVPGIEETEPQKMELGGVIKMIRGFGTEFMIECSNQEEWEFFWDEVCQSEQALASVTGVLTLSLGFNGY